MDRFLFLLVCNVFSTIALQTQTLLLDAIKAKDLPTVQQLVKEGADTNALDETGATPLMWAAYRADLEMVKWLVDNGADPFLKKGVIYLNEEKTAYYGNLTGIAAGEGKVPMLRYLIEDVGIDVDDREYNPETGQEDGWTAAQWADNSYKEAILTYLKSKGADTAFFNSYNNLASKVYQLYNQGQYELAIAYAKKAVKAARKESGADHPTYATSLNDLAALYKSIGRYEEAETLFTKAMIIRKGKLGEDHPSYAQSLNNLAGLYETSGRYVKAELLYTQALRIRKTQLGENHPFYATTLNNLAVLYSSIGQYTKAEPLYKKAIEIRKAKLGVNHPGYAASLNNLAELYRRMGEYDKAEPLYIQTSDIYKAKLGEEHPNYATSLGNMAVLYTSMGQYTEAEPLHKKAMEIREAKFGVNHPDYAKSLNNLAELYRSMGRYDEAELLYLKTIEIFKTKLDQDHPSYATSLNNLALLYEGMGRYAEAETLYSQAMVIREAKLGVSHPDYASSLNNLAGLYRNTGRYTEAETLNLKAQGIYKMQLGKEHPSYVSSLNSMAVLYERMGRYDEAELLILKAAEIRKAKLGENHPSYATSLNNLAALYKNMGRYKEVESLYNQAIRISKVKLGENHPSYATSLNNLAMLYVSMGRYAEAELLYGQAIGIRKAKFGENHPTYATFLNNLAMLYVSMGRYAEAEPLYGLAMGIRKAKLGGNHPDYASSLDNIALLYKSMGRYAEAVPLYTQAMGIRKAKLGEYHTEYATSLNNLALLYAGMGRYAEAETLYSQAMEIRKSQLGENHPDYAISINNMAVLYQNMNRNTEADSLLLQGQKVYIRQLQTVFPTLSEKEKEQFITTFNFNFEYFHSFVLKRHEDNPAITSTQYDNALSLKGLLLQSRSQMRERILTNGDTTAIRLFGDWQVLKRKWLQELEIPKSEREKAGIVPEVTLAEANTLEKELSRRSEAFTEATDTVRTTWREVQLELQQGEAAIELIRYTWHDKNWTDTVHYAALIVTPETKAHPHLVVLKNGNDLEERGAQSYQSAFATRGVSRVAGGDKPIPADSLYAYFWQPIQEALDSLGGAGKVYLSADGVYHTLNLQTLKNPETGKYLLETLDIERVGSTRDLVKKRKQRYNNNNAVLTGYPTYPAFPKAVASALERYQQGQAALVHTASRSSSNYGTYQTYRAIDANMNSISPLSGTLAEVEQLASILNRAGIPTQALLENAASEDVLKKVKSPRILHIATHGFFEPESEQEAEDLNRKMHMSGLGQETVTENPYLRCGLYLAGAETTLKNRGNPDFQRPEGQEDGILTAYEATLLDLRGTELVVLSACETGLGVTKNGEGVYGLQSAFQVAGAETVIFSLWKVADKQTQELMGLFYGNWLEKGMSKRQAFKTAQQTIKEKYKDPYFWGAFVMIEG